MAVQASGSTFTFLWGFILSALYLLFFGVAGRLYLAHSSRLSPAEFQSIWSHQFGVSPEVEIFASQTQHVS